MKRYNVLTQILILFVSSIISFSSIAGNPGGKTIVKGVITDKNTLQPVAYSSVALFDKDNNLVSYGTLTDTNGKFYLKNVPYGEYNLIAYQIGYYKKYVFNIELSENHNSVNVGKLKLSENDKQSYSVEIIGKKSPKDIAVKDNTIGLKDIKNNMIINNPNNL
jgi:hypothetical protein